MKRTEVVNQISQAIRRVAPTATAILYGSEARGDARKDSDIDVLILLDGDKRNLKHEEELVGELYDIELATGVLVSPMIMLRKQWESRPFKKVCWTRNMVRPLAAFLKSVTQETMTISSIATRR